MPGIRSAAVFVLAAVASIGALKAQETEEIANWSAPPFWTAPLKWAKGAQPGAVPLEAEGFQSAAMPFIAVPPCRIADTRGNGFTGQAGGPIILANTLRTFQVTGTVPGVTTQCGILPGAVAVSFQFTVTTMTSAGNLIAWPSGPPPTTSVLNWNANSVAIGSGGVVQISGTGGLNVQINAPIGQAANLIIDVNGFYIVGGMDSQYVNELQANSVTSFMITDGTIVNNDISASAAIADTKLATIATAGKVADTALSANVTKLGSTIEGSEITDLTRSVTIPIASFFNCGTSLGGTLSFTNAADDVPTLDKVAALGSQVGIVFDADVGTPDEDFEVCSQFTIPGDYAEGAQFRFRAGLTTAPNAATESITCSIGVNGGAHLGSGNVTVSATNFYTCFPPFSGSLSPGDSIDFFLTVTSPTTMDDGVRLTSVEFRYTASQ